MPKRVQKMTEALAHYKKKGGGTRAGGLKALGLPPKKRRVRKKKAAGMRAGATKTRRKKKAAGLGSDIGNMVINAAGTAIGVVIGGVYKAGKAAVRAVKKKGGATRVKKKAGMQLGGAKPKRKRRPNPWLAHVKKTMKANKGMAFKAVLKKAKASYKKK